MNNKVKVLMVNILILIGTVGTAKAVDFHSIIVENSKAQTDLHFKIKETVKDSKIAAELTQKNQKYIADQKEVIHIPVSKDFLTFAKEKKQIKASAEQSDKRLAQELKDLE